MESEKIPEKIDLMAFMSRFMKVLSKLWLLVLILALVLSGVSYLRARSSFVPYYESKAVFSVRSGFGGDESLGSAYYYDNSATASLVSAFPSMLGTDMMRDMILAQLDKGYINGTIIPAQFSDTNLFELTVRSTDPEDAYQILCAVIKCYPQVMVYTMDAAQMIIRQEPTVPEEPVNRFSGTGALVKGLVLGLVLGMGVVTLLALLSRTIVDANELKKLVNLPVMASIPFVAEKKRRNSKQIVISAGDDPGLAEALRGLRTRLHKHLSDTEGKVVLLTSTVPGEGKSTISINLAISLAAEGKRVALVDADLRNQSVHRMLGTKPRKGLMDFMKNSKLDVMENLRKIGSREVYYLSGESTSKRYYNIDSQAVERILDTLRPAFDYIILDSPPCTVVSDAALLAKHADAVVYVVKQDYANETQILDGITSLHEHGAALAGTVLNAVPRRKGGSGSYGYGYGYGYGNKYGYGAKKS